MDTTDDTIIENLILKNAKLIFRDFAGEFEILPSFSILLDKEMADSLVKQGWTIRWIASRELYGEKKPFIRVAIDFNGPMPSTIVKVTDDGHILMTKEEIGMLDTVEFDNVNLVVYPCHWHTDTGKTGVRAYLDSLEVTIKEN
jgi:hypothetical protein